MIRNNKLKFYDIIVSIIPNANKIDLYLWLFEQKSYIAFIISDKGFFINRSFNPSNFVCF